MPGEPQDISTLVEQILAYTKVGVQPLDAAPGQRMTVETIPGILPFLAPDFTSQLTTPLGDVTGVLEALVKPVKFTVQYGISRDGEDPSDVEVEPLTAASLPDSDPLMGLLRVPPLLVPDYKANSPAKTELVVTVRVEVEGLGETREVRVPLNLAAIPIPTLLVLTGNNKVFAMARAGGSTSISDAVAKVNALVQTLNGVRDLLSLGGAMDLFLGDLGELVSLLSSGGPAGFAVEEAPDLDDFNDFDDEADAAFLIGPVGTQVRFYSGEEYNELALGDNERTTITIGPQHDIGSSVGIVTGIGIVKDTGWQSSRMWDTDSDDNMDDVESCRFFDAGDTPHPGDPEH